jgi:hypothetical protein
LGHALDFDLHLGDLVVVDGCSVGRKDS